jgi:His-Xaa-Ser system protein HxsD
MLEQADGVSVAATPDGGADFTVDLSIYPLAAVFGCGYVFVDRWYVFLDRAADDKVKVTLSPKAGATAGTADLAAEFQSELSSQALRHLLGEQHEKAREAIMARALFGAAPDGAPADAPGVAEEVGHLDQELAASPDVPAEGDDFIDDPLGIGVPWEERFAAKKPAAAAPAADPAPPAADAAKDPGGAPK